MIICFWSPIRVNPHCGVGRWLAVVWPKHRGGESSFSLSLWRQQNWLAFTICAATFWQIQLEIYSYLRVSLQNGILWARLSKSSVISGFLTEFQSFGPWYLSDFAKRYLIKFSLEHGRSPCSSHCGLSNGGGLPSRPALPNSPPTVLALSCVSKAQGWGGCCFETLTAVRVCGLVKGDFTL